MNLWLIFGMALVGLSLGVLGGGGTILAIPLLVYGGNYSPHEAIPLSLFLVGFTSAVAAALQGFRRKIDFKRGIPFALIGMVCAWGAAKISMGLDRQWLLGLLGGFMMLMSIPMWLRPTKMSPCERLNLPHLFCATVSGASVGALTGLLGAGGGFLIVPALVLVMGMEMKKAVATSVLVIAMNSGAALWGYRSEWAHFGEVRVWVLLGTALGAAGIGAMVSSRIPQLFLRRGFSVLTALLGGGILWKQFF